jgi:acetate kinase
MRILVVNAGSSSLKLRVVGDGDRITRSADIPAPRGDIDKASCVQSIEGFGRIDAVGHRIVHGATEFVTPVLIDPDVVRRLRSFNDLAPLHQPKSLAALEAVGSILPEAPAVACFDTAFHAGMPPDASTFALPSEWRRRWGLRRFGFHGLSHAYASRRAAELLHCRVEDLRAVTCHLGAGASLAAVLGGRSVDTTMGFTPLDGLVMATRSGSVDPGLVLWLEEHAGTPPSELAATLEHRSGLLGLAGTGDMRAILARAEAGEAEPVLALDVYVHRLRSGIAAMAASMGGLDALVFTGGVGENAPDVRERAAQSLAFLGVVVDSGLNRDGTGDREIGTKDSAVSVLVLAAREELEIAREVRQLVAT